MKSLPGEHYDDFIEASFNLSTIYVKENKYIETEELLKLQIEVIQKMPERYQKDLGYAYLLLGLIYFRQERFDEGEPLLMIALEMPVQLNERSIISTYRARAYAYLGHLQYRIVDAENMFLKALEIAEKIPGEDELLAALQGILKRLRDMKT